MLAWKNFWVFFFILFNSSFLFMKKMMRCQVLWKYLLKNFFFGLLNENIEIYFDNIF